MTEPKRYRLALKIVPPIASDPESGRKLRHAHEGEECVVLKRAPMGSVLVRLVSDGFLVHVNEDELQELG